MGLVYNRLGLGSHLLQEDTMQVGQTQCFLKYENSFRSTMASLDISNIITSVEKGTFSLTFLFAPDYFWNP
jgi:hypothetical protein